MALLRVAGGDVPLLAETVAGEEKEYKVEKATAVLALAEELASTIAA